MCRIRRHQQRRFIGYLGFLFISLIGKESCAAEYNSKLNAPLKLDGTSCRTPIIAPLDPVAMKYFKKLEPLNCNPNNILPLVDSNNTAVYINPKAITHFYNDSKDVDCCWRAIHRTRHSDDSISYDEECHKFVSSANITDSEYVLVECSFENTVIYKDVFPFLPRFPSLEQKYKKIRAKNKKKDGLSVLILGLDTLSRNHFYRSMPETAQALLDLGAAELMGYMKVAENTFPNLVPAFTGLTVSELQQVCWPRENDTFDECSFIWKNFSAAGYRTIFAEDASYMSTFNYAKNGFRNPPTDYYLRPYCMASEEVAKSVYLKCFGSRKWIDQYLSYAKKIATQFRGDPYFAIIWQNTVSHDSWDEAQWGDEAYFNIITELYGNGLMQRTALILMSDHGARWGPFRRTYQGRIEDSTPFLFILLPPWWKKKYRMAWSNLQNNKRRMTTHFDLYETLKDLLYVENLKGSRLKARMKAISKSKNLPRGISLFLPIPDYRTCTMAGIPDRWCVCHEVHAVSVNDDHIRDKAAFFVSKLNGILANHKNCAQLELKNIKDAVSWGNAYDGKIVYTLTIITTPGDGEFEATIDYGQNVTQDEFVGSISRVNAYGAQSHCVNDYKMKLYCYCL